MLKLWQNRSIGRMEKKDKIDYWFDIALYDLQTAEAMLNSNRYLYVVFMCQQAIEKLIKAVFIDKLDKEPPRSHNISFIFLKLGIPAEETQLDFFDNLTSFYIEGVTLNTRQNYLV